MLPSKFRSFYIGVECEDTRTINYKHTRASARWLRFCSAHAYSPIIIYNNYLAGEISHVVDVSFCKGLPTRWINSNLECYF